MKTVPAAHRTSSTKLAHCLLVTRADGEVFGFTTNDRPISYLGQDYQPWLNVSSLVQSAGLAVNNLETSILYEEVFTKADFLAGRWDGANWELFEIDWSNLAAGSNTIGHYVTGDVKPGRQACSVELRALSQFLQQPIGIVTSKTCRARFADYPQAVSSARCRLDPADFLVTGTINEVTSQQIAHDDTRSEPNDWFSDGVLTFDSGENIGISRKIKSHVVDSSGVTFTFNLPFPFVIGVGDDYTMIAGCRKRLEEDCRDKFDNVYNFQGEPHLPGVDKATASVDINA